MRRLLPPNLVADLAAAHGPPLIGLGLVLLVAAILWPGLPAVTAMALVALGATGATVVRYHAAAVLIPMLLLHLVIYTTLYALFVGATLDAAAAQASGRITMTQIIDLAVSIVPMAAAAWLSIVAMAREGEDGDATAH